MLLVLVAWFFWQSGMAFLAFLAAIVAVLLALMPSQKSGGGAAAGGAGGYPSPVVMGGTQIPPVMKIKIKPTWGDTTNMEDYAEGLGKGINMVGKSVAWVLRGFKGPGK
jgi:hypothetical protein